MKILKPRYWIPRARLSIATSSYPVYVSPHRAAECALSEQMAQENFSHFVETSHDRVAALIEWLRLNFGVLADYSPSGLLSIQKWLNLYGGLLVYNTKEMMSSYLRYDPKWEREFIGCNIIYDIGTFIGNYLILKRPFLKWEMLKNTSFESFDKNCEYYNKPYLFGSYYPVGDPLMCSFDFCQNLKNNMYIGDSTYVGGDDIKLFIQNALYLASFTPENVPEIFGDVSNGPLE